MTEKSGRGGAPLQTINLGECAAIVCAGEREGFSGAALLARAITNTPANEATLRGMA